MPTSIHWNDWTHRLLIGLVIAGAATFALAARIPAAEIASAVGGVKGDEATYVAMTASLAFDRDLTFGPEDYQRFVALFGGGPEGIFLKRGGDGRLYFGKAWAYAVAAFPWLWAGGLGGLLWLNAACLVGVVAIGAFWLMRRDVRPAPALAFATAFVAASQAPLYGAWMTSDVLNFALVFAAFAAAIVPDGQVSARRRAIGIVLLAVATFSKPLNALLIVPLALASVDRRRTAVGIVASFGIAVALLFAVNALQSGELNYQGGDRKTFYTRFPFDAAGGTFDTTGLSMSTNTPMTPVGAEGRVSTLAINSWYFFAGRHFGLIAFGWPWLVAAGMWAIGERRKQAWQWGIVAAAAASALGTILWMPYTWSGGGGPVGNRYFQSVAAALFFLTPVFRSLLPAALAAIGLLFVSPALAHPLAMAKAPWLATATPLFRWLPVERTGASDLPVILDPQRGRVPQGREPAVFVALLDAHAAVGRQGWIAVAPRTRTELLARSPVPLRNVLIGVKAERACAPVLAGDVPASAVALADGDRKDVELTASQTFSRDSFVFVLAVDARSCAAGVEIAMQGRAAPESRP